MKKTQLKVTIIGLAFWTVLGCEKDEKETTITEPEIEGTDTSSVTLIDSAFFNDSRVPDGWRIGSRKGGSYAYEMHDNSGSDMTDLALKVNYPVATGATYFWLTCPITSGTLTDVAIEFWAKMPSEYKGGLQFVKIYGTNDGDGGYANTTFGLDYTGIDNGALYSVGFGDGTDKGNDTQCILRLDGEDPSLIGRSYGSAEVLTPQDKYWASTDWGEGWHHFKMRVKFNSGTTRENEVADGEIYVAIDDDVYVDAKGVFNRHYTNQSIAAVGFGGWAQNGSEPFEIWYDDIVITTGGFRD